MRGCVNESHLFTNHLSIHRGAVLRARAGRFATLWARLATWAILRRGSFRVASNCGCRWTRWRRRRWWCRRRRRWWCRWCRRWWSWSWWRATLDADSSDGAWELAVFIGAYKAANFIALVVWLRARGRVRLVALLAATRVDGTRIPALACRHRPQVCSRWQ